MGREAPRAGKVEDGKQSVMRVPTYAIAKYALMQLVSGTRNRKNRR